MAFWKKSDDPWDTKPEKKKSEAAWWNNDAPPEKPAPELTPPPWARKVEPLEARDCPWCGQPMRPGHLYANTGARGMQFGMRWIEGEAKGFLDSLFEKEQPRMDFGSCMEAWYCEACRKMVMDTPEPPKAGPNYTWEGGKVKLPEEE